MNIQVTDAIENDVERLIEVYSSPHLYHTTEEASWYVKSFFDYHHIKVVKSDDVPAGWLFWRVESERHHGIVVIDELWVDEKFRRKGLGEKLLRTSIEDAKNFFKRDGFVLKKVLVTTAEDNEPARKLYEKIGFQKSAVLKDLYGKGENEIVYILTLNP
jgi:ribosomal protein S18 acetylase RimI-like enzyme